MPLPIRYFEGFALQIMFQPGNVSLGEQTLPIDRTLARIASPR